MEDDYIFFPDPKELGERGRIGKDLKARTPRRVHTRSRPPTSKWEWFRAECEDAVWELEEDRLDLYHKYAYPIKEDNKAHTRSCPGGLVRCKRCNNDLELDKFTPSQLRKRPGRTGSTCTKCLKEAAAQTAKDRKEKIVKRIETGRKKARRARKYFKGVAVSKDKLIEAQSLRCRAPSLATAALAGSTPHAKECFQLMLERERALCGPYCVFYHSYSFATLLYELNAVWAELWTIYDATIAPLPRSDQGAFQRYPDAHHLREYLKNCGAFRDHDVHFRSAGIAASTNLFEDTEMCAVNYFEMGYSCTDVDFSGLLDKLLMNSFRIPAVKIPDARFAVINAARELGIPVAAFTGASSIFQERLGNMLQIFIATELVDKFAFPCQPFGTFDETRKDFSAYLTSDKRIAGQARICAHPALFTDPEAVQIFHYSAKATYDREKTVRSLAQALEKFIPNRTLRIPPAFKPFAI